MGSSTTQGLSYKSHQVLLASYFAFQLVIWMNGEWHEWAGDASLPSRGLVGENSTGTQTSGSYRGLLEHITHPIPFAREESQRGHMALPSQRVSSDRAGIPQNLFLYLSPKFQNPQR